MGRDRLAALRAQRQTVASTEPAAGSDTYELQPTTNGASNGNSTVPDSSAFYTETTAIQDSIQQFDANVTRIAELHLRSLNTLDSNETKMNAERLSDLTDETRQLSNALASRIRALDRPTGFGQDVQIRKNRIDLVRTKFIATLQRYQDVERQYRQQYHQRVARQVKIVKPDATPEDIAAVVNDDQGTADQIFAQALNSTRHDESTVAYREVQERHQDIRRIEQTLTEVAQLFNDMSNLIVEQEEKIDVIQTQAAGVSHDTEGGVKHTTDAVKHARAARRKRWICFWLTIIIILAAVGIGVGVYFSQHPPNSNNNTSSNSTSSG